MPNPRSVNYTASCLYHWYATAVVNYTSSSVIYDRNDVYSTGHWCHGGWIRTLSPRNISGLFYHCATTVGLIQGILKGDYHCTVDLLFDWFGISCMTTDNFCFYLQNRLIQTSQTEGQWYCDTSPFGIPCLIRYNFLAVLLLINYNQT